MTQLRTTTSETWPATQAFALAAVALLFGVCGGWILRRVTAPPLAQQAAAAPMPTAVPPQTHLRDLGPMAAVPSDADLKKAADSEAAPLLEQLKAAPSDAGLLAKLGNIYYDAKLYSDAIQYYERSLKIQPKDTSVRTDLGTAHWYSGDADAAIAEFNRALSYDSTKADTLFNLGVVKWQGKKDANGAVAAWQKLLDANPGYANKDRVQQFIAQARGN